MKETSAPTVFYVVKCHLMKLRIKHSKLKRNFESKLKK
jgi:hypothetical protein